MNQIHIGGWPIFGGDGVQELSCWLRVSPSTVWSIATGGSAWYREVEIAKRSGGFRTLRVPGRRLKAIQRKLLDEMLSHAAVSDYSKGFRKGSSIVDHVRPHVGHHHVLCLDLRDFYGSITQQQVFLLMVAMGHGKTSAWVLSRIFCLESGVPQGAPTSSAVSNLLLRRFDLRIARLCEIRQICYSRYADDLVMSGDSRSELVKVELTVKHIVQDEGFKLNSAKRRLRGPNLRREVTGLVLNESGFGIGRRKFREVKSRFNHMLSGHLSENECNALLGYYSYVRSVDRKRAEMLKCQVRKMAVRRSLPSPI